MQGLLSEYFEPTAFKTLGKDQVSALQRVLKLNKDQTLLAFECLKLTHVTPRDEEGEKQFRLMVRWRPTWALLSTPSLALPLTLIL